jgi:spermidine/putrescine transport system ATP-binding protein
VGITFLYVTHDQEEALTMSDRLAVMNAGRIVQIGTPREVYEEPADAYVADFLGVSNLMEVEVTGPAPGAGGCEVKLGESRLIAERGATGCMGAAHVAIRPERVRIEPPGSDGPNRVPGMVERLVFLGAATQVMLRLGPGVPLQALIQNDGEHPELTLAQGTPVQVYLAPDALRVLGRSAATAEAAGQDPLVAARAGSVAHRPGDGSPAALSSRRDSYTQPVGNEVPPPENVQ